MNENRKKRDFEENCKLGKGKRRRGGFGPPSDTKGKSGELLGTPN